MKIIKKHLCLLLIAALIAGILAGCNSHADNEGSKQNNFENARIGIMTGSSHDKTVKELYPNAEYIYFSTVADMILAVEQGKIDCYIEDEMYLYSVLWEGTSSLTRMEECVKQVDNGFAFPQNTESAALREQVNEFISAARADGTIDALKTKWLAATEPTEHPDYTSLTGENGTIRLAVVVESKPMLYLRDELCTGFEMDLLTLFAQQYGYAYDIETVPFTSVIAGIATGKYDMAASALNITPEREESVDFSEPYSRFDVVMVVKDGGTPRQIQQENKFLTDFSQAKIGLLTGSSFDLLAQEYYPDAEKLYYPNMTDLILNLKQAKIDGILMDKGFFTPLTWEDTGLCYVKMNMPATEYAVAFPKTSESEPLIAQMNAFIQQCRQDGRINELTEKWLGASEPDFSLDLSRLTGENGTLRVATTVESKPFDYLKDGKFCGFDADFILMFAEEYGYALEIDTIDFGALLPGLDSGRYDLAISSITVTEERKESVLFSDIYCSSPIVMAVLNSGVSAESDRTLADFENATIGVLTGSVFEQYAKKYFPNATREYYTLMPDLITSVTQGKIDGYIAENTYFTAAIWEGARVETVGEPLDQTHAGYIFQKNGATSALREQLNDFIRKSKEDGTLDTLFKKWIGKTEPTEELDYDSLTGENGTIKVAVAPDLKPISYVKNGKLTGYEIELLLLFAKEYGYKLDMTQISFDAILPGVTTGKYDIGTGAVTITEERAQSLDFSESHLTVDVVMITKAKDDTAGETSFWDEIKEDFEKTFIREDRWKLIVQGIGVTMLISICAAVTGTLLGFGLYMLSRSDTKALQMTAKLVAKVYSRIVAGTPVVVILMILFYVIFGKLQSMSGIVVAIIGFTLTFGSFVYDHMTVSVGSVDRGQTEAAYALGYTKNQTFFRIIFPQAMNIFLPSYCGQAVELIKATAVVGYIAVNDLTKMSDIIRSNTYEAFFPLIATAVIYFLLTWLLASLLNIVKLRFEPKRRSREDILKGVKTV